MSRNNLESKDLFDIFNPFFDFNGDIRRTAGNYSVKVDIKAYNDRFEIIAEVPGVKKEDVEISVKDSILTLKIIKKDTSNENDNYLRKEIYYGEISRQFNIGNIDVKTISANMENGVLTVTIPKVEPPIPDKTIIHID